MHRGLSQKDLCVGKRGVGVDNVVSIYPLFFLGGWGKMCWLFKMEKSILLPFGILWGGGGVETYWLFYLKKERGKQQKWPVCLTPPSPHAKG